MATPNSVISVLKDTSLQLIRQDVEVVGTKLLGVLYVRICILVRSVTGPITLSLMIPSVRV